MAPMKGEGGQRREEQQTPLSAKDHLVQLPIGMQAPLRMWDLIPGGYPELSSSWALSPLPCSKTNPMKQLNTCDDRWENAELVLSLSRRQDTTIALK